MLLLRIFFLFLFGGTAIYSIILNPNDEKYPFKLTWLHLWATIVLLILFIVGKLQKIHSILYSLHLPVSIIVSTVYWGFLYKYHNPERLFVSIITHAIVTCYSVFELILNDMKIPNSSPGFAICFILLYLAWTYIYHLIYGDYVYKEMENSPKNLIFYVGAPSVCFLLTILNIFVHRKKK